VIINIICDIVSGQLAGIAVSGADEHHGIIFTITSIKNPNWTRTMTLRLQNSNQTWT